MGVELTLNSKEVIDEFKKYSYNTQKKFRTTLNKTAKEVKYAQISWLEQNVIKWTGYLASHIKIKRPRWHVREIGPFDEPIYRWWIEDGRGRSSKFGGYHYVEHSINVVAQDFFNRLKKDMRV